MGPVTYFHRFIFFTAEITKSLTHIVFKKKFTDEFWAQKLHSKKNNNNNKVLFFLFSAVGSQKPEHLILKSSSRHWRLLQAAYNRSCPFQFLLNDWLISYYYETKDSSVCIFPQTETSASPVLHLQVHSFYVEGMLKIWMNSWTVEFPFRFVEVV